LCGRLFRWRLAKTSQHKSSLSLTKFDSYSRLSSKLKLPKTSQLRFSPLRVSLCKFKEKMMRIVSVVAAMGVATWALSGCQSMSTTQRDTTAGVVAGAVVGAGVAHATGGKPAVGAAVGAAVGSVGAYAWSQSMERQRRELQTASRGTAVQVTRTADNRIKIHMPADATFQSNSARIQPRMRSFLDQFANSLRRNHRAEVLIVGHADSSGGAHINTPLSLQRANATRTYLFSRKVMGVRIQTMGRGANEPVANNSTPAGRAKNRRVEIFVTQPT
jgi:outer membrane protein OmpA-like peptidoglycan-associated protein